MMTDRLRVSVVAAPLAAIDPRALSQAWYSALHLARERPTQTPQSRATSREPQQPHAPPAKTEAASREPHGAMLPCRGRAGSAVRSPAAGSAAAAELGAGEAEAEAGEEEPGAGALGAGEAGKAAVGPGAPPGS